MVEIHQDGTRVARVGDRVELTYGCYKPSHNWNGTTVSVEVFRGPNTTAVSIEPDVTVSYPKLGVMEGMVVVSEDSTTALGVGEYYVVMTAERETPKFGPFSKTLLLKLTPYG